MLKLKKNMKVNFKLNMSKRKLTENEIEIILSFLKPNPYIPEKTAKSVISQTYNKLRKTLLDIEIYPYVIPELGKKMKKMYLKSLIQPGECVGVITAQSIGEKQTQANLNVFHKAGSGDKQPTVSKFSEFLNATNKPKSPSYLVYFKTGNNTVGELRKTIGNSLVELNLKKIGKDFKFHLNKTPEPWYDLFFCLYDRKPYNKPDCLTVKIDMDILFEYKITLEEISIQIENEYNDVKCIWSPDCFGQLDIFVNTPENLEEKFDNEEDMKEVFFDDVFRPIVENIQLCGITGITHMFFLRENNEWLVETENMKDSKEKKFKKAKKKKSLDSTKKFKKLLAHLDVDFTRTLSNNIWDIYFTLGVEAVRQYMIDEFGKIMEGINICHVMLLVDKVTFNGSIASISRYTMRKEEIGPLGKCSFEETLDNILGAGVFGLEENTKGVSASIICGKMAKTGTGLCDLELALEKLV